MNLIRKAAAKRWWWLSFLAVATGVGYLCLDRLHADNDADTHAHADGIGHPRASTLAASTPGRHIASAGSTWILHGTVGNTRPADIPPDAWNALNKALEHDPHKAQERQRLVAYLRFQQAVAQWREMKDGPDVAGRQALARELADQLPRHAGNGEVNAGEAAMLLNAIAVDAEPDAGRQQAWVDAQMAKLNSAQPEAQTKAVASEKQLNAAFASQQAALVAQWQSTPAANRDPAALEAQLQALRDKVYGAAKH